MDRHVAMMRTQCGMVAGEGVEGIVGVTDGVVSPKGWSVRRAS